MGCWEGNKRVVALDRQILLKKNIQFVLITWKLSSNQINLKYLKNNNLIYHPLNYMLFIYCYPEKNIVNRGDRFEEAQCLEG